MKDRTLEMDNGWVPVSPLINDLARIGYSVGWYIDKGVPKYILYRVSGRDHLELVHEFDTAEELNNMVKLLLPPEG